MTDSDWIEWNGGRCPVEAGTLTDVRYRDGGEKRVRALWATTEWRAGEARFWTNDGHHSDIIAYRLPRSPTMDEEKETEMERLTSKKALELVLRIEALNRQIAEVYAEARKYEGQNNDSVIRDAVEARADQRERGDDAAGLIGSFDWDEDEGYLGPESEPVWPEISARLHEIAGQDNRLLPMVKQIDKLHDMAVARGLPTITRAELEAELVNG